MKTILSAALTISLLALGLPAAAEEGDAQSVGDAAHVSSFEGSDSAGDAAEAEAATAAGDVPRMGLSESGGESKAALVVEGAPLGNSNVYVHAVERKPYTNAGRHELVLYPAIVQLNSKFTNHVGVAATYAYHLFENLALQVTPIFNYVNKESAFNQELIEKSSQQASAATALLLQYGAVAGMEITPIYGKFAFYDGVLGHFTFVLNAGAGVGSSRIQLRDAKDGTRDAAYGSTGAKFLGSVGAGFRLFLGERVAVRLEVRDLVYTARVDKINGCTFDDTNTLLSGGKSVGSSCRPGDFTNGETDIRMAKNLLGEISSDVLNNISFYTGFSFLF